MTLEHAARRHAGEGEHQLHGVAAGDADDAPVRMVDVASCDVVAERRLPGRVKADRDAELLDRVPEWLELGVVDVAPADRVRVADDSDRPELAHGAPRLLDGEPDVVERDLGGELQARSEEHTSELQSRVELVCRLLL